MKDRSFDRDDSWNLRLGEIKVVDEEMNTTYSLVIGFDTSDKRLYIRLYRSDDSFVFGAWIDNINRDPEKYQKEYKFSSKFREKIISQAYRLEKLKVFA